MQANQLSNNGLHSMCLAEQHERQVRNVEAFEHVQRNIGFRRGIIDKVGNDLSDDMPREILVQAFVKML
jgi:hypothetical protein